MNKEETDLERVNKTTTIEISSPRAHPSVMLVAWASCHLGGLIALQNWGGPRRRRDNLPGEKSRTCRLIHRSSSHLQYSMIRQLSQLFGVTIKSHLCHVKTVDRENSAWFTYSGTFNTFLQLLCLLGVQVSQQWSYSAVESTNCEKLPTKYQRVSFFPPVFVIKVAALFPGRPI